MSGKVFVNIHDGVGTALTSTLVGANQALDVNIVAGAGVGAGGTLSIDGFGFVTRIKIDASRFNAAAKRFRQQIEKAERLNRRRVWPRQAALFTLFIAVVAMCL